jgi:hypothetical protein
MRGLVPQTISIPFAAGLQQKNDPRAMQPPGLLTAKDVQFDELGGLQTRYPYAGLGADIYGGSSLGDCRRIVSNGDELLLFTKNALYSWNQQDTSWVSRGTHLAVKTEEETIFSTVGDQVACDRAELGGYTLYVWNEGTAGYLAARDTATGAVTLAPYSLGGFQRMRLTPLATKILLSFWDGVNGIYCYALDPASPTTALGGASTTVLTGGNQYYDVCKVPGADQAVFGIRRNPTTSYELVTVTGALVVARSTKARTCDGPIAVSCPPTGTHVQVVRSSGGAIQGDYVAISAFADVYSAQAIGVWGSTAGPTNQIAAAHRSTTDGGQYRCYVFWSDGETSSGTTISSWGTQTNWVDTGNTLGTASMLGYRLGVASRAFDHEGRVFVWLTFAGESSFVGAASPLFRGQLQNAYFMYRDDATYHAKAAHLRAGGFSANTGHLPSVQNTSGSTFKWCGVERQIIDLGIKQTGYGARAPRDVAFTFDSNEARRCARLGRTLYVTGGEILQFDGVQLTEVGFPVFPWYFTIAETAGGSIAAGTYAVKGTWRWDNASGEVDRSTTATVATIAMAAAPGGIELQDWPVLVPTHKTGVAGEVWRTAANPTEDAPFYLVTSKDPAVTANPNRYLASVPATDDVLATFQDELVDADATERESNNENGGALENLAPPAATIIAASADRLFLAGVAGEQNRVWYSKLRGEGEVASFHDALAVNVPREGGAITALAFLNETLIVFKETAIYALPGDGFDNLGGGSNYGPARLLSADCGAVSAEAVALTPSGLIFKSNKGWYLLNRGWAVDYIGAPVSDYDSDTVASVHVVEGRHQVRCLTTSRLLVWDYLVNQWAEWTIASGVHGAVWNGTYHYLTSSAPYAEQASYTDLTYGMVVETAWIPLGGPGWGRVWKLKPLGEHRSACVLKIEVFRNYQQTAFQTKYWPAVPDDTSDLFSVGDPLEVKFGPSIQEMEAIKIRISVIDRTWDEGDDPEVDAPTYTAPTGEALKLTRLDLELGLERGVRPLIAARTA